MKWSAIITTYNSGHVIADAVKSLYALPSEEIPSDVIIVDNASSDNTLDILSSCNLPVKTIENKDNLGLSRANNLGAAHAEGDSLFFLNPDVTVLPGAVTALMELQDTHSDAALIGPAMFDENGNRQSTARTWPTLLAIASRRTAFGKTAWGRKVSSDHMTRFNSGALPCRPHWLVGAALWLTPNGRSKVGLMSEDYFLYFEDVEWCWRAWNCGMEVWYEPAAAIRHVCQRESASGGTTLNYHLKSMLRFLSNHPSVLTGRGPGVTR